MSTKQIILLIAPPLLVVSSYFLFQFLSNRLGEKLGWYLGLVIYWLTWCGAMTLGLIGRESIKKLITPTRLTWQVALILIIPITFSIINRFTRVLDYREANTWLTLMMISTAFGNGFFEELLWRGAYMEAFPENLLLRIAWPTIWFALWHFAPGSVSQDGNPIPLVIGSGFFGLLLGFLAWKTDSIFWCIVAHVVGGLIIVI